jgi:hypothetical protein
MTCNWKCRVVIAAMLIVAWATSAEACHRRRACAPVAYTCGCSGYRYSSYKGYFGAGGGYVTDGGYYGGGYPGTYGGYGGYGMYRGYDFGRPGYNLGGLGGPWSGLGVRPGLGFGGFGPGR